MCMGSATLSICCISQHRYRPIYWIQYGMVLGDVELAGVFVFLLVICVAVSQAIEYDGAVPRSHVCTQICANADTPEECPAIANLGYGRGRSVQEAGTTALVGTDNTCDKSVQTNDRVKFA